MMVIYNVGGGAGINFLRLASYLSEKRNVEFFYKNTSYALAGKRVEYTRFYAPSVLSSFFYLMFKVYTRKPDVLISTVLQNNIVVGLCGVFLRKKFFLRETGVVSVYLKERGRLVRFFYKFLIRVVYKKAAGIIAISSDIKEDLISNYLVDSRLIHVIGNPAYDNSVWEKAIDTKGFDVALKEKRYILVIGRLEKEKRISDVLSAFYEVQDLYDKLVIVGAGREKSYLQNMAKKMGIYSKVDFAGFVGNPFPYIKHASVLVLSSEREGFGNVVVEALSLGCNVIVTSCPGGPKDIIDGGTYGAIYGVGDISGLVGFLKSESWHKEPEILVARAKEYDSQKILKKYESVIYE